MRRKLRSAEFVSDEGGNAIMIFGLSLMPVMLMLGATADYTRFTTTRAALQQAADSAVLTVASKMTESTTNAQAKDQAQVVLNAQPRMTTAIVTGATVSEDKRTVCATAKVTIQNSFMQMAQLATLTPTVKSCANLAGGADPGTTYEIALVLDNSGSMNSSSDGQSKISILKSAANSFVDTMFSKSNNVKFSVVPFSSGVAAVDPSEPSSRNAAWVDKNGANSQHWIAFGGKTAANAAGFTSRFDIFDKLKARNSALDWRGCFEPQVYPLNVNDTTPNPSDAETLFVPFLAPDEPDNSGWGGNPYWNNYFGDNPSACSSSASGAWARLSRACKYNATGSLGGSFGPSDFKGSSSFCPDPGTQRILQLTQKKSDVQNKINQLVANGATNLHEGFMWGWRTLSPNAPFSGGRAYQAPKNRKIMVFMTDGFNSWNSRVNTATGSTYDTLGYYSYNGAENERFPDGSQGNGVNYRSLLAAAANNSSSYQTISRAMQDELTRQACTNAKTAGIEVFTIGFSVSGDPIDAQGLALMKECATNEDHYFKAEDASQLNAAFSQIGIGLGKLRLSL